MKFVFRFCLVGFLFVFVNVLAVVDPLPEGLLQQNIQIKMAVEIWKVVVTMENYNTNWEDTLDAFNSNIRPLL